MAVAEELKVPIISDEIYAGLTFDVQASPDAPAAPAPEFVSVGNVTASVPSLIIGGIAKTFVVPGHRLGWIIKHDPQARMNAVWQGVAALATLIVGPNALVQAGLPSLLLETPAAYDDALKATLAQNAARCYQLLLGAEGMTPVKPQGAMYVMIRVDFSRFTDESGITDDVAFSKKLVAAKNVQVLPGAIFDAPGFVRIVYTKPVEVLEDAIQRIVDFTKENSKKE